MSSQIKYGRSTLEKAAKNTGHKMSGRRHVPRKEYMVAATPLKTELSSLGHIRDMFFSSGHLAGDLKVKVKVTQLCLTLWDPIDGSPPGSAVPGMLQARTLEWVPFPSPVHESEKWKWSRSVVSDSPWPHGPQPTRLLRPWDSPGKSTGAGCQCLLRNWSGS